MSSGRTLERLGIWGDGRSFRECLKKIEKAKQGAGHVLLLGEPGTGKDWLARLFYYGFDERSVKVWYAIEDLSLRGLSPTHTRWLHIRYLENLNYDQQTLLLTVLEKSPLLRVVASANLELIDKVQNKEFRPELFYRLAGHQIRVPPLRERRADIAVFVQNICADWNRMAGQTRKISPRAMAYLVSLYWPGNIAQLKNTLQQALAENAEEILREEHFSALGLHFLEPQKSFFSLKRQVDKTKKAHIESVVRLAPSLRQAAKKLEVSPQSLLRYMKELGIAPPANER